MPVYLYILVGKVVPVELSTLIRSVVLFLIAPFILSIIAQRFIIKRKGRDYFFGPFKSAMGKVKLWVLVLVIISMFTSQRSLTFTFSRNSFRIKRTIFFCENLNYKKGFNEL